MAVCLITSGFDVSCESLKRVSGIKKVWLFNLSALRVAIDPNGTGYITSLEFTGYDGLYLFDSRKYSHQFTSTLTIGDGGNASWTQELVLRLFNDTPTEDQALSDLAVAEVGAIIQTNNGEFLVAGAGNGLTGTAGTVGTGRNVGEDTAATMTLTGAETQVWRRLLRNGNFADTLAYVQALQF